MLVTDQPDATSILIRAIRADDDLDAQLDLAERSFEEERRRTKVIPRLMDEKAAVKLVFATMIRAAGRWSRVSITDLERHQLKLLRVELGLDPPPATTEPKTRRKAVAA